MKKKEEKLNEVLLKVAKGYSVAEITEEYAEVDGVLKLTKRKKTKKEIPPDWKALQMLCGGAGEGLGALSDEELEQEKERLLQELREKSAAETEQSDGGGDGKELKAPRKKRAKPRKRKIKQ
ncbi:MAG: hypothetical protein IJX98_04975 [Clostridia bacterium]|nr:hypothetical protein [Clostridia bacterium]